MDTCKYIGYLSDILVLVLTRRARRNSVSRINNFNFSLQSRKVVGLLVVVVGVLIKWLKCGKEIQIEIAFFIRKNINNRYDKNKVIAQMFSGLQMYLGDCEIIH